MRILGLVVAISLAGTSISYAAPGNASPNQLDAGDLAQFCRSTAEDIHNACKFFLLGAMEMATFSQISCPPDYLAEDKVEIVVRNDLARELEFYPADKTLPAISTVVAILVKTWPCRR